jgi:hypothetical protein
MYGYGHGPSELSGDHLRSELDSGTERQKSERRNADKRKSLYLPKPNSGVPQGMGNSPIMSPMIEEHDETNTGVRSPVSPPTQRHDFDNQSTTGTTGRNDKEAVKTQSWMAPQDWDLPAQGRRARNDIRNGEEGEGGAQGLGVLDFTDGLGGVRERLDDQRAERRQSPRPRACPGAF